MGIVSRVAKAVEALLGVYAEEVNQMCPVIQRERKFTAASLVQTLLLGFLSKPSASDKELAETAALCGVNVTPEAIRQRFTWRLADFAEHLFRRAIGHVLEAEEALAPLLQRFTRVDVLDSTTLALPDELQDRFPGCGGSHGSGKAAMKIQVQWDLRKGGWQEVSIEPGRQCDSKTPLQSAKLPRGSLRITDLGYFDTAALEIFSKNAVFWLSRLLFGTSVFTTQGAPLQLLNWLSEQTQAAIDQAVHIGAERRISCRLLAWRVPEEVANRRRQKLIAEAKRKNGRVPSRERLEWCNWMVLITNVPPEKLTPQEGAVLYRARWQIELLFKRWKSLGLVSQLSGGTVARQMAQLWLRLLAATLEHWLVLTARWSDARLSLTKASQLIRRSALLLTPAIGNHRHLCQVIETIRRAICSTARQNKRKRPNTFELLNNPELIEYALT